MTTAGADTGSTETCTFCGKHRNAVRFLIVASHGVAICEACVGLCSDMLFVEEPLSPAAAKRRLFAPAGPPRTIAVNPDGSGDYATIQEAVAAANPGDTVELADGVYFGEILIDRPLTLRGGGSDRCWLSAEVSGGRVIVVTGTSGVHIAGLRITGVPTSELSAVCIDVSSVDIADCRIEDGGKFGIAVTGGSRLTVTGATIGTSSAAGIAVGDASDVTLQACLVLENAGSGVSASGSQVVVLDSAMRKNGQAGIALLGKSAGRVQNCEIAGNRRGGIVANGESTIRLISGTVYGNLPVGVWVHGGSHAHVEKTIIAGNGSWGIDATGIGGMNNATSAVSLNNCFWANGRDLTEGVGSTLDLFADPLIVADDSGALSLQKGSPCIGDTRAGDGIGASMVSRTTAPALTPSPEHLMQLRSLCLSCVRGTTVPRRQAVGWMASAAAMGLPVPFGVAYDLGLLFRGRRGRLSIACPQHLPMDSAMQSYVALLLRVADHPVTQRMAAARASDRLIALVLTRLFREVPCPEAYRLPTGEAGERFLNRLRAALAGAEPERLWRDTPAAERPSPHAVFSEAVCAVIEANLAALDIDELSFLERLVSCDGDENRDASLVRLLTLTEAEPNVRLTLAGARRLLHDLASQPGSGADRHDMPLGGYCAVTRRPSGGDHAVVRAGLSAPVPAAPHRQPRSALL
ncbi:hypothetical protein M2352_003373 [Azospirillum fermentarium]|uniref:right-handed parallel beta-helix repeat-containing protein n=1 Tax=Azospirillum fermentarium TaxID=1233114 RepID=UPI002227519D|nr:right-handed parallel beta-helix repeat-containing protein [Azospirillum fermentarium]MCW2247739.1 hypothetical protein [Azospirillum fermentarium]